MIIGELAGKKRGGCGGVFGKRDRHCSKTNAKRYDNVWHWQYGMNINIVIQLVIRAHLYGRNNARKRESPSNDNYYSWGVKVVKRFVTYKSEIYHTCLLHDELVTAIYN